GAHIAQALGLVQLRGDQEGAPARERADDPDEPVAAAVEGGEEAFGLGRRGGARGGGGRGWRGDGYPAPPQAGERAADLLAHGALAGARLERQQEGRHLGARELAERGRQRRAVGAGEQWRDRPGPDPARGERLRGGAEAPQRRRRLP